jgi:hypothetical protein
MNMPPASQEVSLPEPWRSFLTEVDEALPREITLQCLGGFVLAALYGLPRPTGDIDYISIDPHAVQAEFVRIAGLGSPLSKKYKLYFQRVGVADYPEEYESRLMPLELALPKLKLLVFEPYDLVLSKLCRDGPKDSEDVKFLAGKLNLNFEELYKRWSSEMKPWVANADRHEITIQLWKEYFPATPEAPSP